MRVQVGKTDANGAELQVQYMYTTAQVERGHHDNRVVHVCFVPYFGLR